MTSYNLYVAFIVIVVVIGGIAIFRCLKKKGIDTGNVLSKVETGLEEAGEVIDAAKKLAPSNALNICDLIDNLALRSTRAVQQLAISSQLPLEERKSQSKTDILDGLEAFKIPVTPKLETVINSAIQRCVLDSKTPEEQKVQEQNTLAKQNATLQATITQLTADKTLLEQQATILNNKLNTVQATVTAVQV